MSDPKSAVEAVTKQESFSFLSAVLDRGYPEQDVKIYLDEKKAAKLVELAEEIAVYDQRLAGGGKGKAMDDMLEKLTALTARRDELVEELKGEAFTVHIKGISPERMEQLQKDAKAQFPDEVEEAVSPITGATTRTSHPHPEYERYYSMLLRAEHIQGITSPSGAVDYINDPETCGKVWANLPLVARAKIDQAINDATLAVDYYRELVDEVF